MQLAAESCLDGSTPATTRFVLVFHHHQLTLLKYSLKSTGFGLMVGESGFQLAGQTVDNKLHNY